MIKPLLIVILALGILFGGVFGWKAYQSHQAREALAAARPPAVTISSALVDAERWQVKVPSVGSLRAVQGVSVSSEVPGTVARIARELVGRIRDLTRTIDALEREIARLVADLAPSLLALAGCGPLTAAKLVGETAGIGRFRSRAAFARHNGSAPVPVWSGNDERHRLSRTGNRQLNLALHRIAVTQMRIDERARRYIAGRRAHGATKLEAIRALRRHLSDVVFGRMMRDEAARAASITALAAAA